MGLEPLSEEVYCQFCDEDIPRQDWGLHVRTEEHKGMRREALDQRPSGVICAPCPHLIEDEEYDDVRCAIGFWARRAHLEQGEFDNMTTCLWGYYNPVTGVVINYYPVGMYDDDLDWEVCAVRPARCIDTR